MKKTALIVIRVVCIVGFLVCAGVLGWYWHSDRSDRAVAEALAAAHDAASAAAIEQVRAVAADNADTIGWLRIDGTNINNVVMFAPDTPGKYLHCLLYTSVFKATAPTGAVVFAWAEKSSPFARKNR